jgi:hypothetical protein
MASEPIVLHLPDESHEMLVSVAQPHSHGSHGHHDNHDDHNDEDQSHGSEAENTVSLTSTSSESHDASSHDHAKHLHGHADVPSQQFMFATVLAGNECYLHQSQLTGITHTPPVPPPNA